MWWGKWQGCEDPGQGAWGFSYAGWISSGDLIYSTVAIVNNIVLYI